MPLENRRHPHNTPSPPPRPRPATQVYSRGVVLHALGPAAATAEPGSPSEDSLASMAASWRDDLDMDAGDSRDDSHADGYDGGVGWGEGDGSEHWAGGSVLFGPGEDSVAAAAAAAGAGAGPVAGVLCARWVPAFGDGAVLERASVRWLAVHVRAAQTTQAPWLCLWAHAQMCTHAPALHAVR
jgi:hypothetical protein